MSQRSANSLTIKVGVTAHQRRNPSKCDQLESCLTNKLLACLNEEIKTVHGSFNKKTFLFSSGSHPLTTGSKTINCYKILHCLIYRALYLLNELLSTNNVCPSILCSISRFTLKEREWSVDSPLHRTLKHKKNNI